MERLKHGTRAEHQALEARLPLMSHALTLSQYGEVLRAFASVVVPLERRLLGLPFPEALAYQTRRHTPALQADLAALGLRAPERALPPALAGTLPGAYGTLYVLEGSTLGGQLISRHLARRLKLGADTGAGYFSGYGADTGPRWRAFAQALLATEARGTPPGWADSIVAEARETFGVFAAAVAAVEVAPAGTEPPGTEPPGTVAPLGTT